MSASLMAEDECEVELRDMVAETLENNGVLPKIRAQLRASVFLALDETGGGGEHARRFESVPLRRLSEAAAGRRCLALVRELLACLQLDCTLSVLDAELQGVAGWREERTRLAAALGVAPADGQPVMAALLAERERPACSSPDSARSAAPGDSAGTGRNGDHSASEEEDSFFDSLPKMKNALAEPARPLEPVRPTNGDPSRAADLLGDLPPLGVRGTLPPLRGAQLPPLRSPATPPDDSVDESVSEELAGDSLASELQSDGLTEDVSITSATELRADLLESV